MAPCVCPLLISLVQQSNKHNTINRLHHVYVCAHIQIYRWRQRRGMCAYRHESCSERKKVFWKVSSERFMERLYSYTFIQDIHFENITTTLTRITDIRYSSCDRFRLFNYLWLKKNLIFFVCYVHIRKSKYYVLKRFLWPAITFSMAAHRSAINLVTGNFRLESS